MASTTLTLDQEARAVAVYMLGIYTEAMAFAGLCEAAAAMERYFTTSDQVAAVEADLMAKWEVIQSRGLPADIHHKLRDLLTQTSGVLAGIEVRLPHVVEVESGMRPASVLAYELYDSDEKQQQMIDLNCGDSPLNPILYNGPAKAALVT